MSIIVEIGRNIRQIRRSRKLSMEEAALEAGISVTWLQRIEKGCANISIDTLERIAGVLGVTARALMCLSATEEEIMGVNRRLAGSTSAEAKDWHIGNSIVQMRKEQCITQKGLARRAKVSLAWLRDVEHGCANATILLLERIAGALGLSLSGLSAVSVPEEELVVMLQEARAIAGKEAA